MCTLCRILVSLREVLLCFQLLSKQVRYCDCYLTFCLLMILHFKVLRFQECRLPPSLAIFADCLFHAASPLPPVPWILSAHSSSDRFTNSLIILPFMSLSFGIHPPQSGCHSFWHANRLSLPAKPVLVLVAAIILFVRLFYSFFHINLSLDIS